MTRAQIAFKTAAVLSAVVLVGGFVAYRAGALSWFQESPQPQLVGGSRSEPMAADPEPTDPVQKTYMYSSKSLSATFPPAASGKQAKQPARSAPQGPAEKKP